LESYTAIHGVEKYYHEPERFFAQVDVKTSHQVGEEQCVSYKNLNQVIAHDHWQEENQSKLIKSQH